MNTANWWDLLMNLYVARVVLDLDEEDESGLEAVMKLTKAQREALESVDGHKGHKGWGTRLGFRMRSSCFRTLEW